MLSSTQTKPSGRVRYCWLAINGRQKQISSCSISERKPGVDVLMNYSCVIHQQSLDIKNNERQC